MPQFNKIFGFISISFVLIFLTKINKVELFTSYFKTLAEVEVRNTQGLEKSGLKLKMASLVKTPSISLTLGTSFAEYSFKLFPPALVFESIDPQCTHFYSPSFEFMTSAPIRAPGIA